MNNFNNLSDSDLEALKKFQFALQQPTKIEKKVELARQAVEERYDHKTVEALVAHNIGIERSPELQDKLDQHLASEFAPSV